MRLASRLARMEKTAAERRPACPCPWVIVVPPAQRDAAPPACPRCGKAWRVIVMDEDPSEVPYAAPRAA